jgi:hypothetical protein
MSTRLHLVSSLFVALLPAVLIASCTDAGTDPAPAGNLSLSVVAAHDHAAVQKTTHQALVITSAKVLVRDIRFKSALSDDSVDVSAGAMIVELRPDRGVTEILATRVRPGTYDRIRLSVHKPEDVDIVSDPEFRDGPSGRDRYSIVVKGLYHDTPFTYRSREGSRQELFLNTPLSVPENGQVSLTLKVDPYDWFTSGALVLDPFTQGDAIDDRIKSSFGNAYRDANRDGSPD